MRVQLALGINELALGGGNAPPTMHYLANAAQRAGILQNGANEVYLHFNRGITSSSGELGMHGAAHGGIQQGGNDAAMHGTQRIVMEF